MQCCTLTQSLQSHAPWLKTGALVIEASFMLSFLRYRMAVFLLLAAIVFNFGVFYLFGFLFWTWITLDIVLLGLLVYVNRLEGGLGLFGVKYLPLAVVLIVAGSYWARPPALGWYDTRLTYTCSVLATFNNGDTVRLDPAYFEPYGVAFTMTGFGYLVKDHGVLVGPYGSTHNNVVYEQFGTALTAERVFELEKDFAPISYDEQRAARMYQFIERFVRTRNARGDMQQSLSALHSPVQFWSNSGGLIKLGNSTITAITVLEPTWLYDGVTLSKIRQIPLHSVNVDSAP